MNKVDKRQISYTNYAPHYDQRRYHGDVNEYIEHIRKLGLGRVLADVDRDDHVLDVGCGTGRGATSLAELRFRRVTGLDFTEAMLSQANEKRRQLNGALRIDLVRGDAFKLPFPDACFDVVLSLRFVHMFRFELQQELTSELHRVCKPGGRVVVELESIHKGLFVTRYLEQRRVRTHQKFNSRSEVGQMFDPARFDDVRVAGTGIPMVHRALYRVPSFGERLERVCMYPPFNWMAAQVIVSGVKR